MKEKQTNKIKLLTVIFLLFCAGILTFILLNKPTDTEDVLKIDDNINIGDISGLTEEEMQDALNSKVAYNMLNVQINTSIVVSEDTIQNLNLVNNANKYEGYKYSTSKKTDLLAVSCEETEEGKYCTKYNGESVKVKTFNKVSLTKSLRVQIYLDGEESPIFESGLVPYGSYLKTGNMSRKLQKGVYEATAVVSSYDDNNTYLGKSNVKIQLYSVDSSGNYQ